MIASLRPQQRRAMLSGMAEQRCVEILYDWPHWARPEQLAPNGEWQKWLYLGRTSQNAPLDIRRAG
jgi:phage terminase large subunit-like protein